MIPHGTLMGGMNPKQLQRTVAAFQADELRALFAVSEVGGVGLGFHDLHGNHPRETLIFPGWSALSFEQLIGRVNRDGGKSHSDQRVLLAAGTVEQHVYATLTAKLNTQSALTDEDFIPWRTKYPLREVEIALEKSLDNFENSSVASGLAEIDLEEKAEENPLAEDDEIPF
jgi:hypothetical protein